MSNAMKNYLDEQKRAEKQRKALQNAGRPSLLQQLRGASRGPPVRAFLLALAPSITINLCFKLTYLC